MKDTVLGAVAPSKTVRASVGGSIQKAGGSSGRNSGRTSARKGRPARLRPAPSRPWAALKGQKGLNGAQRERLLLALLSAGSFDEACLQAGVARGAALLARSEDRAYAAQWDEVMALRIAEVDARLADLAIRGLQRGLEPGEDARQAIALGQWLVESRKAGATPARRREAGAASAAVRRETPAEAAEKVERMFHEVREREEARAAAASAA